MKMRTIGAKLTTSIIVLLFVTCSAIGLASYFNSSSAIEGQLEESLKGKAEDIREVTRSTGSQHEVVGVMSRQAEKLADMAAELRIAISRFTL